jgi:hypothetical protein
MPRISEPQPIEPLLLDRAIEIFGFTARGAGRDVLPTALADAGSVQGVDDPHINGSLRQRHADIALDPVLCLFA